MRRLICRETTVDMLGSFITRWNCHLDGVRLICWRWACVMMRRRSMEYITLEAIARWDGLFNWMALLLFAILQLVVGPRLDREVIVAEPSCFCCSCQTRTKTHHKWVNERRGVVNISQNLKWVLGISAKLKRGGLLMLFCSIVSDEETFGAFSRKQMIDQVEWMNSLLLALGMDRSY